MRNESIYVAANGCGVLRHETNRITKYFIINGFTETTHPEDADVLLFVACGMTNEDVELDINYIKFLQSVRKEGAKLIVTGCLPAIQENLSELAENIIIYTYTELHQLDTQIGATTPLDKVTYNIGMPNHLIWSKVQEPLTLREDRLLVHQLNLCNPALQTENIFKYSTQGEYIWNEADLFQIRIAYGCSYACSYCSTRLSVGKFHSVPLYKIMEQYKLGVSQGYKRFMLLGTELGSYGRDIGLSIVELLQTLHQENEKVQVGIRYIHPDCLVEFFDGLRPYFESGYIYFFCAAIQTSSARLLKKMNRNPDLSYFIECIEIINKYHYPVIMHSQIMVGFPGERLEELFDTLMLLDKCRFLYVNVNKFSQRPMTLAFHMGEQVPEKEKIHRFNIVKGWMERSRKEQMLAAVKNAIN